MELRNFLGKKVNVYSNSSEKFSGTAVDYIYADESESGNESIIVSREDSAVEFERKDIRKIEVIQ
ncbi:MAG: hypothetical protein NC302_00525 [Bacteroidales bacterium]|nr:hypothetical protein [Bacteroidales bacterium]MCM1422261.1 hypothetical protein [bacterium]